MYRIRTCRCACCGLDLDIAVDVPPAIVVPVCARCTKHQELPQDRDRDHAAMYRTALTDAQDETELARDERDFYRDRSRAVAKSGETLVGVLTEIHHLHHARGSRCSCGDTGCLVLDLVSDPSVARLIGTYDEERFVLHEVSRENPGAVDDEWDYIDVTLVYPPDFEYPAGRHRAAG